MKSKNSKIVKQIKESLTRKFNLKMLVVFGSSANGKIGNDIDLLVVKDSKERRDKRDLDIRKCLNNIQYPMDILVYTPKEVEKLKKQKDSFLNEILRTGKIIYEPT